MKKMPSRLSAHRVVTAATVVLAAGTVTGLPSAAQASTVPSTGVTVSSVTIPLYGTPGNLDVTVAEPTAADAYLQVEFNALEGNRLTVTDDAGTALPMTTTSNLLPLLTVGEADSDHNGIPGAPLPAGTVHLHVSAHGPVSDPMSVSAQVIDGVTEKVIAHSGPGTTGELFVQGPDILPIEWKRPDDGIALQASTVTIETGDPRPTTDGAPERRSSSPAPGSGTASRP
jgi:hypothetical protein